jgi:hypothetical protein
MQSPLDTLLIRADWRALPPEEQGQAEEGVPVATHEAYIVIGSCVVRAFQLSDGRRVLEADDFLHLMDHFVPFEEPEWKGVN